MIAKTTSIAAMAIAGVLTSANAQDQCDTILNTGSIDVTQGGVSCADAGITTNNFFAKSYDLTSATDDFYVNCIEFGAGNTGTTSVPLEIAIYVDTDGGPPQAPGIDMVEVSGSRVVGELAAGPDGILQVNYSTPIRLAAGDVYVVEMFIGASTDGFCSIASNEGPDAPTYIRTDDCGLTSYVTYESIGFPTYFWAQQLIGSTTDIPCDCFTGSNCFVVHEEPGCDDPICEALVCGFDPFCCDVDGTWDDTCAAYSEAFCNFTGFDCDFPTSTTTETELCGEDTNGGCNMETPAFESISSGDIVAGSYYVDATADVRDTDWYQFTIDQVSNVTWTVHSRVAVDALIVTTDCVAGAQVITSGTGECPTSLQICLQPGTYAAFVAPNTGGGNLPCELTDFTTYTAELDIEPLESCPGFDICDVSEAAATPNSDQALTLGGIACQNGGITLLNTYAVTIDLAGSDAAGNDFNVNCISFGTDNSGSLVDAKVQLWIDADGGDPTGTDLELIGTRETILAQGIANLQTASFDPPICVPADSQLVVTLEIQDSTDGFATFAGNSAPSESSTYVLSEPCGLTTFTKLEDIGFPDFNWVVDVQGDLGCSGPPVCPGDFNDDGVVNGADFGSILAAWGPCAGCPEDMNGDGVVGGADVGLLLSVWGPCAP